MNLICAIFIIFCFQKLKWGIWPGISIFLSCSKCHRSLHCFLAGILSVLLCNVLINVLLNLSWLVPAMAISQLRYTFPRFGVFQSFESQDICILAESGFQGTDYFHCNEDGFLAKCRKNTKCFPLNIAWHRQTRIPFKIFTIDSKYALRLSPGMAPAKVCMQYDYVINNDFAVYETCFRNYIS